MGSGGQPSFEGCRNTEYGIVGSILFVVINRLLNILVPLHFSVYTWSSWKPQPASSLSIEFMPMLWGKDHVTEFRNNIKVGFRGKILGFNEYGSSHL